ncbi:sigma 54-interacting transcriptional regulator [Pedobacter glucosidilyticus]|uniref:sigma-54-dependent transcriptional regulator n=1 Tax=Pedobacter glucosidilyticus TaxID=1122941 RepID=UPI00041B64F3
MRKVLLIDDEDKLRTLMARIITLEGFEVIQAADCKTALKKLEQYDVDIILCDVKLPDGNGVTFVKKIKEQYPIPEVILLTAYGNISDGVQAIKNGAFDYIIKGDDNDKIIPLIAKAMEKSLLQRRVLELEAKIAGKFSFKSIIGKSDAIKEVINLAEKVAKTDTTVLLLGETGSGKEVFANAIHYESKRANKKFVAINCSALSKELLESELFGHKAGAFTGALKDKKGLFEEAHLGTLFLDEIGELDIDLQAKLLRVLETGTFIKVGATETIKVDVRIIAATNRNLQKEAEENRFRLDLFYRLSVFSIAIPSLNQRKEDIELLADFYLKEFAAKINQGVKKISPDFLKELKAHQWKGNVRELKNMIERAVILASADELDSSLLPWEFNKSDLNLNAFDLQTIEKQHILKVLHHTSQNKTEAARLLNIGLTTLYRKLEEYGLK